MGGETKSAIFQLAKGETTGWQLILREGDERLFEEYYAYSMKELPESKREFYKGKSFEEAKVELTAYSERKEDSLHLQWLTDDRFQVSKFYPSPTRKADVDLKWGLWYDDESTWENFAPGVYAQMEDAFKGKAASIHVHTAPQKEIRYGDVTIQEGEATVTFYAVWDAPSCHIPKECPEESQEEFEECIASHFTDYEGFYDEDYEDPVGAKIQTTVEAATFPELMEKIDELETQLLEQEAEHSKDFKTFRDELMTVFKRREKE